MRHHAVAYQSGIGCGRGQCEGLACLPAAILEEMTPFIRSERGKRSWESENLDSALLAMGQVMGRIKNVPPVADLIKRTMEEALEAKQRVDQLIPASLFI
jgi:NAD(P)H-dependent flavin oxidoreductase YrpB (nitropropane dioxygenase family)